MVSTLVEILSFFSNLGFECKALGLEKNNFGSMLITSVGSGAFKIEDGYAPLLGFTHTVGVATICSIKQRNKLQLDGSYVKKEVITVNVSLDHRYLDGMLCAKLLKEVRLIN